MTDKEKVIQFCAVLLNQLIKENKNINIRTLEYRKLTSVCDKSLELVDGAMIMVGDSTDMGMAYEIRLEITDNKEKIIEEISNELYEASTNWMRKDDTGNEYNFLTNHLLSKYTIEKKEKI